MYVCVCIACVHLPPAAILPPLFRCHACPCARTLHAPALPAPRPARSNPPHGSASTSPTRLPAGDYWPGEAENLLASIGSDALGGGGAGHKGGAGGGSSRGKPIKGKRVGPATGSATEELLRRLGETIQVGGGDFWNLVLCLWVVCSV
jgi:hypothetical protein